MKKKTKNVLTASVIIIAFLTWIGVISFMNERVHIRVSYEGDFADRELIMLEDGGDPVPAGGTFRITSTTIQDKNHVFCQNEELYTKEKKEFPLINVYSSQFFNDSGVQNSHETFFVNAADTDCTDIEKQLRCAEGNVLIHFTIERKPFAENDVTQRYVCYDYLRGL